MASADATNKTERTPLLFSSNTTSSASSISIPSSDISDDASHFRPSSVHSKTALDEEARLDSTSSTTPSTATVSVGRIVCVLLVGTFISNADSSLLLATHPIIASEFNALHDSSWLLTSFALAQASTQPLYGKLSDIYGRKSMLLLAYALFAFGCGLVGIGGSMSTLILGRVISGAGSSGMTALVSVLITDLAPLRDVASWRAYINVVATTGRSIGGPLGGWLADSVGWRWSFLGQVPLAGIAILLVAITLPPRPHHHLDDGSARSKLARIDFIGAILMTLSILALLIPLEVGGDRVPWSSPIIMVLLIGSAVFGALFLATEAWIAKEPMLPLSLLRQRDVVVSFFVMFFQSAAQTGLMFAVPLYFQVTAGASNTVAGAHLVPAVVGNAVGGMLSGTIIHRTGRYKALILVATIVAATGYLLLILRWHGHTNWFESLYIFPGGFGMGIVLSALFISVQVSIPPAFIAIATSTLYLTSSVGFLAGMAGVSAVLQEALSRGLDHRLVKLGFSDHKRWKIIERAVSDVHYADKATPLIGKAVIGSYVEALTWTHVVSLACSITAFVGSLFLRQHKL
ncbi:MFS general substrate transporter [Cucurbitaria berberidis CBS 394.84]|uniref:MFS general substrate transporter n=1 Tax=Cucurbitaria berberidis CBS 394.84 TaxID=1168544 RepID=A0A9P4LB56_9PLEO|nr:MFS general substrate transporter [Cucurbitaria berberidis CBS 394.84]KAF1849201.1 MFS general substrate transporter [Cucurbitaria berberidis CBS 394.84]